MMSGSGDRSTASRRSMTADLGAHFVAEVVVAVFGSIRVGGKDVPGQVAIAGADLDIRFAVCSVGYAQNDVYYDIVVL